MSIKQLIKCNGRNKRNAIPQYIYIGGQWTRSHMQEINMWEDMGDRHESEL